LETTGSTPSGSSDIGRVLVKQWTKDSTAFCSLYVRGSDWFSMAFTKV